MQFVIFVKFASHRCTPFCFITRIVCINCISATVGSSSFLLVVIFHVFHSSIKEQPLNWRKFEIDWAYGVDTMGLRHCHASCWQERFDQMLNVTKKTGCKQKRHEERWNEMNSTMSNFGWKKDLNQNTTPVSRVARGHLERDAEHDDQ